MSILDNTTFAKYGYRVADLHPKSAKPVIYACDGPCGKTFERQWRRAQEPLLFCHACKVRQPRPLDAVKKFKATMLAKYGTEHALQNKEIHQRMCEKNIQKWGVPNPTMNPTINDKRRGWGERKYGPKPAPPPKLPLPFPPQLDQDATFQRYGYRVTDYTPCTSAFVLCHCERCAKLVRRQRAEIRVPVLCRDCLHCDWWITRPKTVYEIPGELPILDDETQRQLGYAATSVSPGDSKLVICRCSRCFKDFARARRNIQNPVHCASCVKFLYWEKHHDRLLAVRNATLFSMYGAKGPPAPTNCYGKTEEEIRAYLVECGLRVFPNNLHFPDSRKSLDVYLPDLNAAIEYCGLYHHHEFSRQPRDRHYHRSKMDLAASHGIRLYTLFEDEWIMRSTQTKAVLRAIFNVNVRSVYARDCTVSPLNKDEAKAFINLHHLQPLEQPPLAAWLLNQHSLPLGVLTLRHDYHGREGAVILNRLCFAENYRVVGGAGKLFAAACAWARATGYKTIISMSDNRWSDGRVYERLGFQLARDGSPDYAYVNIKKPNYVRIPKESRRKTAINCPAGVTEWVYNKELGYARIWDCGHKRWEFML